MMVEDERKGIGIMEGADDDDINIYYVLCLLKLGTI